MARYKIPEGNQILIRKDGTFCFIPGDGFKFYEGPIFPIKDEKRSMNNSQYEQFMKDSRQENIE